VLKKQLQRKYKHRTVHVDILVFWGRVKKSAVRAAMDPEAPD
jgi:hypothetical protein